MSRKTRGRRRRAAKRPAPGGRARGRLSAAALPAALVAVTILAYHGALGAEFTYDDHFLVLGPIAAGQVAWSHVEQGGRPVRGLTLLLDRALFGAWPPGYHAHSLLWHVLATLCVYALVRRLSGARGPAFAAALLFGVHPIHVEAVANVANRKEPLCLVFSLAALLAYARYLDARRLGWLAAAGLAGLLALLSKQVAVVLPLAAGAYELLFVERERRLLLRRPLWAAGVAAAAALAAVVALAASGYFGQLASRSIDGYRVLGYEGEPSLAGFVLTSARAFWWYLSQLAVPTGLCPDHVVTLSAGLGEPRTLLAWLGFVAFVGGSVAAARLSPLLSFGLAWIWIHFLPVSNWIPSAYVLADRYMYVPSVGFCIALVAAALWLRDRLPPQPFRWLAGASLAALALVYAAGTVAYTRHWRSNPDLWRFTLSCCPDSQRGHDGMGTHYLLSGEPEKALEYYDRAVALDPDAPNLRYNRANALYAVGRYEEAVRDYERIIRWRRSFVEAHYNLGNAYFALGEYERAVESYDEALQRRPDYADALVNRGRAWSKLGELDRAFADYERAVEVDPDNAAAHYNLASHLRLRGEREAALRHYARAASLGLARAEAAFRQTAEMPTPGEGDGEKGPGR